MLIYLVIFILLACIILLAGMLFYQQKQINKSYNHLLQSLDAALGGTIQEVYFDETFESAITERLNRLIQISGKKKENAETERDIVKSFISDISHQIRTPLSNIILYSGLLQETNLDEATHNLANKIDTNANKLNFFMEELIKASYTEPKIITLNPQMVSAGELLNKACQIVELAALKKNIYIHKEITECMCYADTKWTIEAISNVIENAIKYSNKGSDIFLNIIPYESFCCISVTDSGIGIAEEEQGKIFQRFYRGKNVKNDAGFGIGLYLAREVLSKQGGYIKVDSRLNKGTTVSIFLTRCSI